MNQDVEKDAESWRDCKYWYWQVCKRKREWIILFVCQLNEKSFTNLFNREMNYKYALFLYLIQKMMVVWFYLFSVCSGDNIKYIRYATKEPFEIFIIPKKMLHSLIKLIFVCFYLTGGKFIMIGYKRYFILNFFLYNIKKKL